MSTLNPQPKIPDEVKDRIVTACNTLILEFAMLGKTAAHVDMTPLSKTGKDLGLGEWHVSVSRDLSLKDLITATKAFTQVDQQMAIALSTGDGEKVNACAAEMTRLISELASLIAKVE